MLLLYTFTIAASAKGDSWIFLTLFGRGYISPTSARPPPPEKFFSNKRDSQMKGLVELFPE